MEMYWPLSLSRAARSRYLTRIFWLAILFNPSCNVFLLNPARLQYWGWVGWVGCTQIQVVGALGDDDCYNSVTHIPQHSARWPGIQQPITATEKISYNSIIYSCPLNTRCSQSSLGFCFQMGLSKKRKGFLPEHNVRGCMGVVPVVPASIHERGHVGERRHSPRLAADLRVLLDVPRSWLKEVLHTIIAEWHHHLRACLWACPRDGGYCVKSVGPNKHAPCTWSYF